MLLISALQKYGELATSQLALSSVVLLVVYLLIDYMFGVKPAQAEPRFLPSRIPYFGHLINIICKGVNYYEELVAKHGRLPYSLAMPGGRLYVLNLPEHVISMQKAYRELSFWSVEASFTKSLAGISDYSDEILRTNAEGQQGIPSLVVDGMKATHAAMTGPNLSEMIERGLHRAASELEQLSIKTDPSGDLATYCLWEWTQHVFSLATSSAVYGPGNPYEDLNVEKGLYQFEDSTMLFLTGLPLRIFVRKGYAAREVIVAAFKKFFAEKSDSKASQLVKNRADVLRRYAIPEADIARFETANGFGILLNLLPTAYWTIWHVFSDRALLHAVREEAKAAFGPDASLRSEASLNAFQSLPLLTSVMSEALRYNTTGAAVRRVTKDHLLNGQLLLKKGSYCLVPNKGAHFDSNQWGSEAHLFQADRFLKTENRVNGASFRGFGGGVNLCPGKSFATRLIVTTVAAMALQLDIEPCTPSGALDHPGHDESSMAIVVARPAMRYRVRLVPRGGK
ncbi:hypothetical protein QQS21_003276 [Conoideocrella luteorostrata]|uniref:Cytochrome P450 n=1 Tax=Conoideocrella luteorostrata TaxID=1105319 RepID=A0AAJ0CTQ0_9HYPO|nr:hypothetical protein QQS21_003276 [Conoideocrella luteorostrata]